MLGLPFGCTKSYLDKNILKWYSEQVKSIKIAIRALKLGRVNDEKSVIYSYDSNLGFCRSRLWG